MISIFARLKCLQILTIATLATIALPLPGLAADRLVARFRPFKDFSISVRDLETFAQDGKIPADYASLVDRVPPARLQELRQLLQQRLELSPEYIQQFTRAPLVEKLLERIGESVQTDSRQNGMKSLQTAIISAAEDKDRGLTLTNVMRRFPGREVNLELAEVFTIYDSLTELFKRRDSAVAAIDRLATAEAATYRLDFSQQPDLRRVGIFRWQKQRLEWIDRSRQRLVPGDLYLPQTTSSISIPLIVISHGVAENRTTFAYLAEHLASHGFAVVAIEHIGGDANRFQQYFSSLAPAPNATELLERPRDVSFLLDELQRRAPADPNLQKLNLRQVGLAGHSLGGYTILALAGAQIDFDRVKRSCNPNRSLNLSVLLQCRANELKPQAYRLQDPRIKAIFAINPLGSTLFGKQGLSQIRIPVFLVGGSDDIVTPAVPEQIYPFTWLQTPDKYLAMMIKGTHFSTPDISNSVGIFPVANNFIGPEPARARVYTNALSLAFFQTHLADRREFQVYLNAAYARSLAQSSMGNVITPNLAVNNSSLGLNLVRSTAADAIAQSLATDTSRTPKLQQ